MIRTVRCSLRCGRPMILNTSSYHSGKDSVLSGLSSFPWPWNQIRWRNYNSLAGVCLGIGISGLHCLHRFGSKIGCHQVNMKGMRSNAWSNSTLIRGVRAVDSQPGDLLSHVKLEQDAEAIAAVKESCHCKTNGIQKGKKNVCCKNINHCALYQSLPSLRNWEMQKQN